MENSNLYKIYFRDKGHLDNAFITAVSQQEAVERFNRLFPMKNIVDLKQIHVEPLTFH